MTTAPAEKIEPRIRWLIRRDFPHVRAIVGDDWDEGEFRNCLNQRNVIANAAEHPDDDDAGGRVLGYSIYALDDSVVRLLDLRVHPNYRRRGVATALIRKIIGKARSAHKRNRVEALVPETALDVLLCLRRLDFLAVGVQRRAFNACDGIQVAWTTKRDKRPTAAAGRSAP